MFIAGLEGHFGDDLLRPRRGIGVGFDRHGEGHRILESLRVDLKVRVVSDDWRGLFRRAVEREGAAFGEGDLRRARRGRLGQ